MSRLRIDSSNTGHGSPGRSHGSARAGFRGDIEGLRAIAVMSVILWHADIPGAAGGFVGVDAFFVISGYLMVRILTSELARTGGISLMGFYARRAKRLLPAATLTLVAVVIAARTLFRANEWREVALDTIAANLYAANWRLITQQTDYMAEDRIQSPVQHFWSLSVEEQFYAVFPVLLIGWFMLWRSARRRRAAVDPVATVHRATFVLLFVVSGASLTWCLLQTSADPQVAYFSTFTRVWELGLGGVIAVAPAVFAGRRWRGPVSIAALIVLVGTIVWLPEDDPFPGWRALLPTVATALLVAAGAGDRPTVVARLLALRPMIWIGGLSYSLYLWHWPVLLFGKQQLSPEAPMGLATTAALVGLTFVLAWASYRFVEDPIRRWRPRSAQPARIHLRVGAALSAVSILAAVAVVAEVSWRNRAQADQLSAAPGARVVPNPVPATYQPTVAALQPITRQDPVTLEGIAKPEYWTDECYANVNFDGPLRECDFGRLRAARRVVLVGDSHAGMWQPAVDGAAQTLGLRASIIVKHECPLADVRIWSRQNRENLTCRRWYEQAMAALLTHPPEAVLTSFSWPYTTADDRGPMSQDKSRRQMVQGLTRTWDTLAKAGVRVYVIAPVGRNDQAVKCTVDNGGDGSSCLVPRERYLEAQHASLEVGPSRPAAVRVLELNRVLCPGASCPAVVGGLFVYRDRTHISAIFAASMADHLVTQLVAQGFPRQ